MTPSLVLAPGGGQLGRALVARGGARVIGRSHAQLDITDANAVARALDELRPGAVINAAAYTAVDRAESERDRAYAVNRDGAALLAAACAARGLGFIQVSTDYVFDGDKGAAYREDEPVAPLGVYGASKAAGEAAVRAAHPQALVVRTSWLFSAHPPNFVLRILELARRRPVLRVVADQHGSPTYADDLARVLLDLLERRAAPGIYHACGEPATTWHGLAVAIVDEAARAGRAPRVPVEPIATADWPTAARRPAAAVLDMTKLRELGITPGRWIDGVRAVVLAS